MGADIDVVREEDAVADVVVVVDEGGEGEIPGRVVEADDDEEFRW